MLFNLNLKKTNFENVLCFFYVFENVWKTFDIKNLISIVLGYMSRVLQLDTCKNVNDFKLCLEYDCTDVRRCRHSNIDGTKCSAGLFFVDVSKTVHEILVIIDVRC